MSPGLRQCPLVSLEERMALLPGFEPVADVLADLESKLGA
jgi:hypothetical protein